MDKTFTQEYEEWEKTITDEEKETIQMFGMFLPHYQKRKLISRIRILKLEERKIRERELADMFYYDIHHSCLDSFQVGEIIDGKYIPE